VLRPLVVLLALAVILSLPGCSLTGVVTLGGPVAPVARVVPSSAPRPVAPILELGWATTDAAVTEDGHALVELRLLVDNRGRKATESTSILWEPAFARAFTLTASDPSPWRVRVDERGWGVLDTAGVLPGQWGTFRLWFGGAASPGSTVAAPRIVVVADGRWEVADTLAEVRRPVPDPRATRQFFFDRGTVAAAADRARLVPTDPQGALPLAAGMAVLLGLIIGGGVVAVLRCTASGLPRR
jgi:hypothetical protein